jgi:hypothetical protein
VLPTATELEMRPSFNRPLAAFGGCSQPAGLFSPKRSRASRAALLGAAHGRGITRSRAHARDPAQHARGRARGRGRPLRDPNLSLIYMNE